MASHGPYYRKKTIETRMAIVPLSSVSFYSNEIIEYLGLEKELGQIEEQNAKENERSVNIEDEELQMFVEQQKYENTRRKTDSDLRTWLQMV